MQKTVATDENVPVPCDLVGDGSRPYALPTLKTIKHDRFKRIDANTLVKLIDGHFKDTVSSFTIVDCRYPYEYQGGHIVNSVNLHTSTDITKFFIEQSSKQPGHVVIFHCEFSSERGPKLMKFLREKDRQVNEYPELIYPEIYLLDGGYKEFYQYHKEYCEPQSYKPMRCKDNRSELHRIKKQSKSRKRVRQENLIPEISFEGC